MGSSLVNQNPSPISRFQHSASFERRPKLLKDFLRNDSFHSCSTSSSNGFQMYPRMKSKVQVVPSKSTEPSNVLLRSRSKRTISALHKVINVVRFFPFASVKSPLVLPRSFSRKLSTSKRSTKDRNGISPEVSVKVKDILRWRSFRDLAEEESRPVDFPTSSPKRSSSTTSTTTTTTSCSKTSSWCDSDFTGEDLPFWCGENEECLDKKSGLGEKIASLRNHKGGWSLEESDDQQQSPVSVLESLSPKNEEYFSPFHRSLANIQRTKCTLTRRIEEFEALISFRGENKTAEEEREEEEEPSVAKEKAKQLLSHVEESNLEENGLSEADYHLISDFFTHELSTNEYLSSVEFESKIVKIAKSWMNGEYEESCEWELEGKRETYVMDMEKGVEWKKFEHEKEETSKELEVEIWDILIDNLLEDLISY